ncbi:MAG TPA: putative PEP-binding protein, partial [Solirubrobacterales bacterium]|nr:putative PEP-binding protein [Solirubrobacterales bacterium]
NDLMQFLFAVDRENRLVANRFDSLSAPSLRALRLIAERAAAAECPATVCGEIGGHPLEAMALIALGFRRLSMSPAAIGPVKAMIVKMDLGHAAATVERELARSGGRDSLRPALAAYADSRSIPV